MSNSGIHASRAGSCRLHQHRDNHGAKSATECQKHPRPHGPLHKICNGICHQGSKGKDHCMNLYEQFILVFGAPTKLLSDQGVNFTSALVEELCSAFGIQKCRTTAYHVQCSGQVECFHQTLFK